MVWKLCRTGRCLCLPVRSVVQRIFVRARPCQLFRLLLQKFVIRKYFCSRRRDFCSACIHVKCIPSKCVSSISSLWGCRLCLFPSHAHVVHVHRQKKTLLTMHKQTFSSWCCSPSIFQNLFELSSDNNPAKKGLYRCLSRITTGSSILNQDLGHLCRGRRIQMSGHSGLGSFNNCGGSSILTWVYADTTFSSEILSGESQHTCRKQGEHTKKKTRGIICVASSDASIWTPARSTKEARNEHAVVLV